MLVSSTFARQPLLAVVLVFGLLVAFGALFLRLQEVLFGEPSGPVGHVKASYVPLFLHLAVRARRRPVAAGAGRALVPRRRGAVGVIPMPSQQIATLLSSFAPLPGHRPWPRYEVDADTWTAVAQALGEGGGDLLGLWADDTHAHLAVARRHAGAALRAVGRPEIRRLPVDRPPSCAGDPARAHHPRSLRAFAPIGSVDRRPWLDHGAWGIRTPLGTAEPSELRDPADYEFLPVHGEGLHEIPVGPVHAGIIEPGHFRFTANGETVARLEERLGYVHKGIDRLLTGADLARARGSSRAYPATPRWQRALRLRAPSRPRSTSTCRARAAVCAA